MTPIKQTILGPKGNCFAACIASILDCPISNIPDLNAYEESEEWMQVLNDWLSGRGLGYMECLVPMDELDVFFGSKDFYHVIVGPTERNSSLFHAVVGRKGKVVFDPHPTDLGLIQEDHLRLGVFIYRGI
jgi:hypothetical protein